jgi:hypothetical protein
VLLYADSNLVRDKIDTIRKHIVGYHIYVYIETTTYCSDIQAYIVVICYTDGLTARWRYYDAIVCKLLLLLSTLN